MSSPQAIGMIFLFAARGAMAIRSAGLGVLFGAIGVIAIAATREFTRLSGFADAVPDGHSLIEYADPSTGIGAMVCFVAGMFACALRCAAMLRSRRMKPRRLTGKRAIHGSADWMTLGEAKRMFGEGGGIVVGEAYRVDKDSVASHTFRADDKQSGARAASRRSCASTLHSVRPTVWSLPARAVSRPPL